jgi:phage-related minor tail protein
MTTFNVPRLCGGYLGGLRSGGRGGVPTSGGGVHEAGHLFGFKDGGDLTPHMGGPVLVGEEGPELIVPTAPATVLPVGTFDFQRARRKRLERNR